MAENNSKTFIIGIIIFVLLVIGGFAFFAKKDVAVEQTTAEMTAPAPEGAMTMEVTPVEPAPAPTPIPTPADEVTPTAEMPANNVEAVPASPSAEAGAPAPEATGATPESEPAAAQ